MSIKSVNNQKEEKYFKNCSYISCTAREYLATYFLFE